MCWREFGGWEGRVGGSVCMDWKGLGLEGKGRGGKRRRWRRRGTRVNVKGKCGARKRSWNTVMTGEESWIAIGGHKQSEQLELDVDRFGVCECHRESM